MRILYTAFMLLMAQSSFCQTISGTVYTNKGDLLPFASITVKGTSVGTSANEKARFSFNLPRGTYTIVCQYIGYESQEKTIDLSTNTAINFLLKPNDFVMNEVIVKSNDEDPAYEIIRQAIKKRNYYHNQVSAYQASLYGKDLVKLRHLPKKIMGQKIKDEDRKEMGLDSSGKGIIYLSESNSVLYKQQPDKFKLEVNSSRVSGSGSFGFTFPSLISLYTNNVQVFTERLNPRGFISPIADGALSYYKYKFLGTSWENGVAVNSIRVTPRRKYEPLFSGIINIEDREWRIHSFDLLLTKTAQLDLLDTLQIKQLYLPVSKDTWMQKNQLLHFNFKMFNVDMVGNFLSVYSDHMLVDKFGKNFFDRVIIKYDTAVAKKTNQYWDSIRPVPLEPEEILDYQKKDSIYKLQRDSSNTLYCLDSLRRKQGPFKPLAIFWKGIERRDYSRHNGIRYSIAPVIKELEYTTAEGIVINLDASFTKSQPAKKMNFSFQPHLRYGVHNEHLNAWAGFYVNKNNTGIEEKFGRSSVFLEGGKRVSEFNKSSVINPFFNSLGILLYGKNNIKTYENWFGSLGIGRRFESGLNLRANATWEDRIPLYNTTNFTFFKKDSINITPNYPYEKLNSQFEPHQALSITMSVSFRPGQRYIQFPDRKISIGSRYPNFIIAYTKGIENLLGSDVNFDNWKFTVTDDKNLKLAGLLKYKAGLGGFLNDRKVYIQDYQHFNGNRSIAASEYVNSFQLASFYANSTTAPLFSFAHIEYHLNGLLTNKIPLFRKLGWNLLTGSNAFYVNTGNNHVEVFAGLENIFKIFRVDFVAAYENGSKGATGVRIGGGGSIGSSFGKRQGRRQASPTF